MGIETVSMALGVDEAREIDISGEYFELRTAVQAVVRVELLDRSGGTKARMSNPLESDYVRPGLFEKIRITNGPVAQAVVFVAGTGDAGSRRNSGNVTVQGTVGVSGTVSVVDGAKDRTDALVAFSGFLGVPGAATQFPYVELWNPAASGKDAVLSQLLMYSTTAQSIAVRDHTVAIASAVTYPGSKKLAKPASSMEMRFANAVANVGGVQLATIAGLANTTTPYKLTEPIIIPPGRGILICGNVAASDLGVTFEFTERATVP